MAERWLLPRPARPAAKLRLVCLAWAGGSSAAFARWHKHIDDEIELIAVELPGRMSRVKEPFLTRVEDIVEALAAVLQAAGYLDGSKPFALFGHSFGALLAFELTRTLTRQQCKTTFASSVTLLCDSLTWPLLFEYCISQVQCQYTYS
jgi:medium-chain acyl-[acyl-carrier-protein] hydrolase